MIQEGIMLFIRKMRAIWWWHKFKRDRKEWVKNVLDEYSGSSEFLEEVSYLKKYGADYFPYEWSRKKHIMQINGGGYRENSNCKPYVWHNGKKLYVDLCDYSQLLLEQNINSPHRYFTDTFNVEKGDVFVDIGAAEGMISLDVIDNAKRVYLIECDRRWMEKLKHTFSEYSDKVIIIPKYVSDQNDEKNITLDQLLEKESGPIVLKIDVEGMEENVLCGAKEILSRKNTKVAICTYHATHDAEKFKVYFENLGYNTEFSKGYMAMVNDKLGSHFRKAMLRAWK